jgi:hypothetical protein
LIERFIVINNNVQGSGLWVNSYLTLYPSPNGEGLLVLTPDPSLLAKRGTAKDFFYLLVKIVVIKNVHILLILLFKFLFLFGLRNWMIKAGSWKLEARC